MAWSLNHFDYSLSKLEAQINSLVIDYFLELCEHVCQLCYKIDCLIFDSSQNIFLLSHSTLKIDVMVLAEELEELEKYF